MGGRRALRYYLTNASTGNEDLGDWCLHGTGICVWFYGSDLRFAINDDPSAGSRSENFNITS